MFCYVTRNGETKEVQLHVRRPNYEQGAKVTALLESADANAIADAIGLISDSAKSSTVSGLTTAARFGRATNDFICQLTVALLDVDENRFAVGAETDEEFATAIRKGTGLLDFAVLVAEFASDPVLVNTVWPLFKNSNLFQRLDSIGRAVSSPVVEDDHAAVVEDAADATDAAAAANIPDADTQETESE